MITFCLHLLGYFLAFWYSFFFVLFLMLVHLFILISKKKNLLKKKKYNARREYTGSVLLQAGKISEKNIDPRIQLKEKRLNHFTLTFNHTENSKENVSNPGWNVLYPQRVDSSPSIVHIRHNCIILQISAAQPRPKPLLQQASA